MNTQLSDFIHEALGYEADAFKTDAPINGGDLLQWFSDWRIRAKAVLRAVARRSPRRQQYITATELREAIDALGEAAETRRNEGEVETKNEEVHRLIAKSYARTARKFKALVRVLERDRSVLQAVSMCGFGRRGGTGIKKPSTTVDMVQLHDFVVAHGFGAPTTSGYALGRKLLHRDDDYALAAAEIVWRGMTTGLKNDEKEEGGIAE